MNGWAPVITSSGEIWAAIFAGQVGLFEGMTGFILPVLPGNIFGGRALFTFLAHGQVKAEL